MNKVILQGRLTADPEILAPTTSNGHPIARFAIACSRRYKNKDGNYDTDFINCTAFGATADLVAKYYHKGDLVLIEGEWRVDSFTAQDGTRRRTDKCMVTNIYLQPRSTTMASNTSNQPPVQNQQANYPTMTAIPSRVNTHLDNTNINGIPVTPAGSSKQVQFLQPAPSTQQPEEVIPQAFDIDMSDEFPF